VSKVAAAKPVVKPTTATAPAKKDDAKAKPPSSANPASKDAKKGAAAAAASAKGSTLKKGTRPEDIKEDVDEVGIA